MVPFAVFVASLALLGAALSLKLRRRRAGPGTPALPDAPADPGQDLLPDGGDGSGDGLAAFYAYQLALGVAAGCTDPPR